MAAVCLHGSPPHRTARLLVLALGPQVGRSVVVPLAVAAAGLACRACHQVGLLAEGRASIARAGGDADAAARPSVDDGYAGGALSLPRGRIMNPRHAHTVMLMLIDAESRRRRSGSPPRDGLAGGGPSAPASTHHHSCPLISWQRAQAGESGSSWVAVSGSSIIAAPDCQKARPACVDCSVYEYEVHRHRRHHPGQVPGCAS
jgi:hypothetical protein